MNMSIKKALGDLQKYIVHIRLRIHVTVCLNEPGILLKIVGSQIGFAWHLNLHLSVLPMTLPFHFLKGTTNTHTQTRPPHLYEKFAPGFNGNVPKDDCLLLSSSLHCISLDTYILPLY